MVRAWVRELGWERGGRRGERRGLEDIIWICIILFRKGISAENTQR